MALDEYGVQAVSDLLGENVNYAEVRSRLISAFIIPQATRFRTTMQLGSMGDHRPTQMLQNFRSNMPKDTDDAIIKEAWLQRLSPAISNIISRIDGSLDSLAERADLLVDALAEREMPFRPTR